MYIHNSYDDDDFILLLILCMFLLACELKLQIEK